MNVSWDDANAYCKWLSEKTKKHYSLPTEAEWEKAAQTKWKSVKKANILETGLGGTSEVGQYSPQGDSPYGCADMAGNVWEWTSTLWGDDFSESSYKYPYNAKDGREHLSTPQDSIRILRRGCFRSRAPNVRCATRFRREQILRNNDVGFRVAFSPFEIETSV